MSRGIAQIKAEYIIKECTLDDQPADKKAKVESSSKKKRGTNKHRHKRNPENLNDKLCSSVIVTGLETACQITNCKYSHSIEKYLALKPPELGNVCYVYETNGYCPRGITCRFLSGHGPNKIPDKVIDTGGLPKELQTLLRKKEYDFKRADEAVEKVICNKIDSTEINLNQSDSDNNRKEIEESNSSCDRALNKREKKTVDWRDKLYLAPLTTLGNLPFRRICKEFGADITCGEMAIALNILQGQTSEWALLKRHRSEDVFGVQLCGNNPQILSRCSQLVEDAEVADFIDLNLGCPIDFIYKQGAGSGLLRRENLLQKVVRSMVQTTQLPTTVKTRTGIYEDKPVALKLMPVFREAGVNLVTVHGRSREQRYTKNADWNYVEECARAAAPVPVFGSGDVFSYDDYIDARRKYSHISGVMIGRGALYKPWIFTEIKEERHWDISAQERFEILKRFVNYGFEHWGSDARGVETTRRFLLEWLSFLYRYIPIGLLENPPQKMNERPPRYVGRNDLETLMVSPNCADWIKISEMLCGSVPENFHFVPKHKSNSWE